MKVTATTTVEIALDDDESIEVEVTAELSLIHDSSYGSDADGNRGYAITEIDNIDIISMEPCHGLPLSNEHSTEAIRLAEKAFSELDASYLWRKERKEMEYIYAEKRRDD